MVIITNYKTKTELIQYLHRCCFIPTPRTFLKAIKNGNFLTWLGLKTQKLLKHMTPSIATALGYMDQEIKKPPIYKSYKIISRSWGRQIFFNPDTESVNTHELCATITPINLNRKGLILNGAFPHKTSREILYVIAMYDYDGNVILAKTIKNRQATTIHNAFLKVHKVLKAIGNNPKV